MKKNELKPASWELTEPLWDLMWPLLPKMRKHRLGGRPPVDQRVVAEGIFYILRTRARPEPR